MSLSNFIIGKELGKGAFGSVKIVTRKEDNKIYAMKTVNISKLNNKEKQSALNEIRILASLSHPNIIGYKEAFFDEPTKTLNIVMEYADDGDIEKKIKDNLRKRLKFTENTIWEWIIQILEGLKYLHDNKIMHRDLKCANIFLMKNGLLKLGDLNVSKIAKMGMAQTQTGTPYYCSPEIWRDCPYNYKSDIWSVGCIVYELCALKPPFRGTNLKELCHNVLSGYFLPISEMYSNDLRQIINMMLVIDPNKRSSTDELLGCSILQKKIKNSRKGIITKEGEKIKSNPAKLMETIKMPKNLKDINKNLPKKRYRPEDEMMKNDEYETMKATFFQELKKKQQQQGINPWNNWDDNERKDEYNNIMPPNNYIRREDKENRNNNNDYNNYNNNVNKYAYLNKYDNNMRLKVDNNNDRMNNRNNNDYNKINYLHYGNVNNNYDNFYGNNQNKYPNDNYYLNNYLDNNDYNKNNNKRNNYNNQNNDFNVYDYNNPYRNKKYNNQNMNNDKNMNYNNKNYNKNYNMNNMNNNYNRDNYKNMYDNNDMFNNLNDNQYNNFIQNNNNYHLNNANNNNNNFKNDFNNNNDNLFNNNRNNIGRKRNLDNERDLDNNESAAPNIKVEKIESNKIDEIKNINDNEKNNQLFNDNQKEHEIEKEIEKVEKETVSKQEVLRNKDLIYDLINHKNIMDDELFKINIPKDSEENQNNKKNNLDNNNLDNFNYYNNNNLNKMNNNNMNNNIYKLENNLNNKDYYYNNRIPNNNNYKQNKNVNNYGINDNQKRIKRNIAPDRPLFKYNNISSENNNYMNKNNSKENINKNEYNKIFKEVREQFRHRPENRYNNKKQACPRPVSGNHCQIVRHPQNANPIYNMNNKNVNRPKSNIYNANNYNNYNHNFNNNYNNNKNRYQNIYNNNYSNNNNNQNYNNYYNNKNMNNNRNYYERQRQIMNQYGFKYDQPKRQQNKVAYGKVNYNDYCKKNNIDKNKNFHYLRENGYYNYNNAMKAHANNNNNIYNNNKNMYNNYPYNNNNNNRIMNNNNNNNVNNNYGNKGVGLNNKNNNKVKCNNCNARPVQNKNNHRKKMDIYKKFGF